MNEFKKTSEDHEKADYPQVDDAPKYPRFIAGPFHHPDNPVGYTPTINRRERLKRRAAYRAQKRRKAREEAKARQQQAKNNISRGVVEIGEGRLRFQDGEAAENAIAYLTDRAEPEKDHDPDWEALDEHAAKQDWRFR